MWRKSIWICLILHCNICDYVLNCHSKNLGWWNSEHLCDRLDYILLQRMREFNHSKHKVLHLCRGNPQHLYNLRDEGTGSYWWKAGHESTMCACSACNPESQQCPGLHQKKHGSLREVILPLSSALLTLPTLEIFKVRLDRALSNLIEWKVTLFIAEECWTRWPSKVFFNPKCSMILCSPQRALRYRINSWIGQGIALIFASD